MKVKRITNWYKYKEILNTDHIEYIARYADEDNNQILIFYNEKKDRIMYTVDPTWGLKIYKLINNIPIKQLDSNIESRASQIAQDMISPAYKIPLKDNI